jgi:hypothetical protein
MECLAVRRTIAFGVGIGRLNHVASYACRSLANIVSRDAG